MDPNKPDPILTYMVDLGETLSFPNLELMDAHCGSCGEFIYTYSVDREIAFTAAVPCPRCKTLILR